MKEMLRNYTNEQLEEELLSRKKCEFNKEGCTRQAELYGSWEIQRDPICYNCWGWVSDKINEKYSKKLERNEI